MPEHHTVTAPGALAGDLSWLAVERLLAEGAMPVITIGTAAKEHGYHLPLNTDALQAQWLGRAIAARYPALVWPPINIGFYPAFLAYPGSISRRAQSFEALVLDVITSIARHTAKPILAVNTGISTIAPLENVRKHPAGPSLALHHVYRGAHLCACAERICEQRHSGHGDEVETSVMLAIAPGKVQLHLAQTYDRAVAPGPLSRQPGEPNYTPQGIWGDPARASRQKGKALLAAMLRDLDDSFRRLADLA